MRNLDRYRADLERLITVSNLMRVGVEIERRERAGTPMKETDEIKSARGSIHREYQRWYSEADALISQFLPARSAEFQQLYKGDGKRKKIESASYTIQDWLLGIRSGKNPYTDEQYFDDFAIFAMRLMQQAEILKTVQGRFESSLFDIAQFARADLFDSELDAARELLKHKFLRAAGIVAGVVLEKHLQQVAEAHKVTIRKKNPTIGDLNDPLKEAGVLDIPTWRQIQRLGDLRNLSGHSKDREPTAEEVGELIDGTSKVTKTIN